MKKIMVVLLIALGLLLNSSMAMAKLAPGDFIDTSGHWAEDDIQTAVNLGLMNGVGTTAQGFRIFAPEDAVSRAQLAMVLQRTFQLDFGKIRFIKAPVASDYYPDVQDQTWYSEAVVLGAINHIFDSVEFKPDQEVTRLEIARSVYRAFTAKNISVPMIMIMPDYKDIDNLTNEDRNAVVFTSNTGIMKGDGTYFRPGDKVKRAELARVMNRCLTLLGVNEGNNGKEYSLPADQTFTLVLNSNPTTGYEWNLSSWDKNIITLESSDFLSSNTNLAGSGGQQFFKFKALKPGSTELSLNYARPWESVQPQQKYNLKVTVTEKNGADSALQLITKPEKYESDLITVEMNIPEVSGLENTKVQSAINQEFIQDANQRKASLESEARSFKNECDQNGYPFRPYGFYSSCDKFYENGKILSLYVDYYQYTGGAHGLTERYPYNYDLATGKNLALTDLFKSGYDYQSVINDYIKEAISNDPEVYFTDEMGGFKAISANQGCYLQNSCLVVFFNQYEIAPYAAGIREFRLPLTLFTDGFKDGLF